MVEPLPADLLEVAALAHGPDQLSRLSIDLDHPVDVAQGHDEGVVRRVVDHAVRVEPVLGPALEVDELVPEGVVEVHLGELRVHQIEGGPPVDELPVGRELDDEIPRDVVGDRPVLGLVLDGLELHADRGDVPVGQLDRVVVEARDVPLGRRIPVLQGVAHHVRLHRAGEARQVEERAVGHAVEGLDGVGGIPVIPDHVPGLVHGDDETLHQGQGEPEPHGAVDGDAGLHLLRRAHQDLPLGEDTLGEGPGDVVHGLRGRRHAGLIGRHEGQDVGRLRAQTQDRQHELGPGLGERDQAGLARTLDAQGHRGHVVGAELEGRAERVSRVLDHEDVGEHRRRGIDEHVGLDGVLAGELRRGVGAGVGPAVVVGARGQEDADQEHREQVLHGVDLLSMERGYVRAQDFQAGTPCDSSTSCNTL